MSSITQNPRSQASHPQCGLFSLCLDFSLFFIGSGHPVSSPATPPFPFCMATEESSHTLGLNRKSNSAAIPLLPRVKYCVVQQNHGALELFGFTVFIPSTPAHKVHV